MRQYTFMDGINSTLYMGCPMPCSPLRASAAGLVWRIAVFPSLLGDERLAACETFGGRAGMVCIRLGMLCFRSQREMA